ncbi:MAG: dTDP-4-dehydrorhamnose reductase [Fibrobacter sp.]|jgi:dTDP-4-dehydrorhamnose reductase|nr:dTDP-4-dehydrorhamnose reductase [Fibrobacter sp.]
MKALKIWITGASGMLGKDLQALAVSRGHRVFPTDRELDITDAAPVSSFLAAHEPDYAVNAAAYTAVDLAETETELNEKVNALGPKVLGECCARAQIPLLHISTDYVLSGEAPQPLLPDALFAPVNAYGKAKARGEVFLKESGAESWILRTAWLYGIHGKNFVKTMLSLMKTRDEVRVVNDQFGNPTWTCDLARAVLQILENGSHFGTYHFSGEGITSWFEFALKIREFALELGLLTRKVSVIGIPSSEYPTPARRPHWSALSKEKLKETFGISIPLWETSLFEYLKSEAERGEI